jgi:hypothetical protein
MSTVAVYFIMKFMKLGNVVSAMIINCGCEELKTRAVTTGGITDMAESGCDEEIRVDAFVEESIQKIGPRSILK